MGENKTTTGFTIDPQTYKASERIRVAELDGVRPCHADIELVNGAWLGSQFSLDPNRLAVAVAIARADGFQAGKEALDAATPNDHGCDKPLHPLYASKWPVGYITQPGSIHYSGPTREDYEKIMESFNLKCGVGMPTQSPESQHYTIRFKDDEPVSDLDKIKAAHALYKAAGSMMPDLTKLREYATKLASGLLGSGGDEANQYREELKRLAGDQQANAATAVPNGSSQVDWPADEAEPYDPFDPKNWGV